MSKGPWKRYGDIKLPLGTDVRTSFSIATSMGANVFTDTGIAKFFGLTSTRYVRDSVVPRAIAETGAHFIELVDQHGNRVGWATRQESGEAAGRMWRAYANAAHGVPTDAPASTAIAPDTPVTKVD